MKRSPFIKFVKVFYRQTFVLYGILIMHLSKHIATIAPFAKMDVSTN